MSYKAIDEEQILKQEYPDDFYQILLENVTEGIGIIDANGIVKYKSPSCVRILGYSIEEHLGKNAFDLVHPEDEPVAEKLNRELMENPGKKIKSILRFKHKSGKWIFLEAIAVNLLHHPSIKGIVFNYSDVTERVLGEEKQKVSEKKYQQLAAFSPVGIFKSDSKGRCIYVNEKWCEIAGISSSSAIGDGWIKAVHPADRAMVKTEWSKALKEHRSSVLKYRFKTPGGKVTWVLGQAVSDGDSEANGQGYTGSITDITDQIKTEQQLRDSENRNRALVKAIPDMILKVAADGTFLDFEPASNTVPMLPPEKFIGKKIRQILPSDIARLAMRKLKQTLKTRRVQSFEYSILNHKDRHLKYFEARIIAFEDNCAFAVVRDVTLKKEGEIALRKSEENWRTLVENAPNYIIMLNSEFRIVFVNRYTRFNRKEVVGKKAAEFIPPALRQGFVRVLKKVKATGKTIAHEVAINFPAREKRWFHAVCTPQKHGEKIEGIIIMAFDITQIKKAEQEVKQTNQKLFQLNQRLENIREEEKKKIAMEIHDELGQELTGLKLGIFWLNQYMDEHLGNQYDRKLREKINYLIALSTNTIGYVRKIAHELRPVILDNLGLIPAIEWQVNAVSESSSIHCQFTHKVNIPITNRELSIAIFRIVQESLTNIIRHSGATKVLIDMVQNKSELVISISDNGKGITAKAMEQPGKIGLFGIKERVKNWKGTFSIKGRKNKGTNIVMSFPIKNVK